MTLSRMDEQAILRVAQINAAGDLEEFPAGPEAAVASRARRAKNEP
jgi:hypothetical protein